ncbi:MAG TPA: type II CAAX endopeptidase family protein [Azospirillaceae bacterium]|nr:type II CAAX endopeptidase family protein [Azospirillaceae bacterium]
MSSELVIAEGGGERAEQRRHLFTARGTVDGGGTYLLGTILIAIGMVILTVPFVLLMKLALPAVGAWLDPMTGAAVSAAITGTLELSLFLGSIATIIPLLRWLLPWMHGRAFGELIAPDRRLDLGLAARAAALFGGIISVPVVVHAIFIGAYPVSPTWTYLPLLVVAAAVPLFLQVTAEELLFRGYLTQGLGLVVSRPWVIFVLVSLLFSVVHGAVWIEQAWHVRLGFFVGALLMSWAAWRADRLEPAIGIHFANNCVALLLFQMSDLPDKPSLLAFDPEANIRPSTLWDMGWESGVAVWSCGLFWYLGFKRDWLGLAVRR